VRPSSSYFFHAVGAGMIPTEVFAPCHERVQLLELTRNGGFAQLLFLFARDEIPAFLECASGRPGDLSFHKRRMNISIFRNQTLVFLIAPMVHKPRDAMARGLDLFVLSPAAVL